MHQVSRFYVDGCWVDPLGRTTADIVNPATETVIGTVALGSAADVDRAVRAARRCFDAQVAPVPKDRRELLLAILDEYERRAGDLACAMTAEMGAPAKLAAGGQVAMGVGHLRTAARTLEDYNFAVDRGTTRIVREPIGVCGLITPWNWPMNQISCKVIPALAVGCTVVLKPSECAPLSAQIFAEVIHAAGVPAGAFNLVHGSGPVVGASLAGHPDVDLVSITGSTRAGINVALAAAPTVKRVHQELGGKSPYLVLDDDELEGGVRACLGSLMNNAGQSCNAPSRLLVPAHRMTEAAAVAKSVVDDVTVGDPCGNFQVGPVAGRAQWEKIQDLIGSGSEDAKLVAGGLGRPSGLDVGYYVRPTVFAEVTNDMRIAREEIFGPVLSIIGYRSIDEAVGIANDTEYGLVAYVSGADHETTRQIASRLRAGQVRLNGAPTDLEAPFGGYKRSGNGREWGREAFTEYLETKAIVGYGRT